MTNSDLPGDLTGGNPLVPWLNKLKRCVGRRTLMPGLGYKLRDSESGVTQEILPGSGGTSPGGGMNYRGAFNPETTYALFDVVVGLPGINEGTFIAVIDNPVELPWTGIGWVQLAPGSNVGSWT